MDIRLKNAAGTVVVLSGFSAFAQEAANLKPTSAVSCASCPPPSGVIVPGDPTWFVAGFVVGLVLGIVVTKVFSKKQ